MIGNLKRILVFIIFMFVFVCIQTLLKRFIDQIFIKEEKQQADYLKTTHEKKRNDRGFLYGAI